MCVLVCVCVCVCVCLCVVCVCVCVCVCVWTQATGVTDQSRTSGCLVISGRCWPSAADEEWHSPKRPYSTLAVNRSELNTKLSAFFFCTHARSTHSSTPSHDWRELHVLSLLISSRGHNIVSRASPYPQRYCYCAIPLQLCKSSSAVGWV